MIVIEPISSTHNRLAFTCGNDAMDRYLHESAQQAKRKGLAVTFVATDTDRPNEILGFYCLSSFMIEGVDLPDIERKRLKMPTHRVAATLLGRLAVAKPHSAKGIGTLLVADALRRAYIVSGNVGSTSVVADAIDEGRVGFYEQFGFVRVDPNDLRLVIMMDTIAKLLPGISSRVISSETYPA